MFTQLWETATDYLQAKLSPQEYETWIKPLSASQEEETVVILAPNRFFIEWLKDHYLSQLNQALLQVSGRRLTINFQTAPILSPPAEIKSPKPPTAADSGASLSSVLPTGAYSTLNPRYNFKNFIVGHSNQLAHAACLAVASQPDCQYNPIFIFGGTGLGKTHLLYAVGNLLLQNNPTAQVHYCSAESFTNELEQAIHSDEIRNFQTKYRTLDCLLLDDFQFFAGRELVQEEFLHTFNVLYNKNKQIIVSGEKTPQEIEGLEQRLRSRFEWGLLVDLQPPDEKTIINILQKKAAERNLELSSDVALFLARQPEHNIRVLEGYISRIIAVSHFQGVEVTLDLVNRVIGPLVTINPIKLEDVLRMVAAYYNITIEDLKGNRKNREISHPRQVMMYLSRKLTKTSFLEIGRILGGKDHSTVLKGVQRIESLLQSHPNFAEQIKKVENFVQENSRYGKSR